MLGRQVVLRAFVASCLICVLAGCQNKSEVEQQSAWSNALERRDYARAQALADQYLREHPTGNSSAEALYVRGRALEGKVKSSDAEAQAQLREARTCYEKALTLNPGKLEGFIRTNLGNVHYFLNDYPAGEKELLQAAEQLEQSELRGWVRYRAGLCQQRQGKWELADKTFAAVLADHPDGELAQRARDHQGKRGFYVQVASFSSAAAADQTAQRLRASGITASRMTRPGTTLHPVLAGPYRTYAEASAVRTRVTGEFRDALITP